MTEKADELKRAHTMRHDGIQRENAGDLREAEQCYDEALALYRQYETGDTLDFANAVRYSAAIKMRLGSSVASFELWSESLKRYENVMIWQGVAESAAYLALLSFERSDMNGAEYWLGTADVALSKTDDDEVRNLVEDVRQRIAVMHGDASE